MNRRRAAAIVASAALIAMGAAPAAQAKSWHGRHGAKPLGDAKRLVVIYEENHSFDNLYGGWGPVNGQHVIGRSDADAAHTTQVSQAGTPYSCLKQNDVNLDADVNASAALAPLPGCNPETVTFPTGSTTSYKSHFANSPFGIDAFIPPTATTCPVPTELFSHPNGVLNGAGLSGGCTRDLVHRFYQEQYQLNGGAQNRYVTGSDGVGLAMGYYETQQLPIYRYLHGAGAPHYVLADGFFQAAFGGSYLNHQFLVAAQPPLFPNSTRNAVLDASGNASAEPLYQPTRAVVDGAVTQKCGQPTTVTGRACGDWAVNTLQPGAAPFGAFGARQPLIDNGSRALTIGDRMSDAGVSWAWYAGGWDNAAGNVGGRGWTNGTGTPCTDPNALPNPKNPAINCADRSFQFHHQPFAYYSRYAPGTVGRAQHLKDEEDFLAAVRKGKLPRVSFVKPLGSENEHPGYASEPNGSNHLVELLTAITEGPKAKDTVVVVTYDEFGGQWDHVTPPGQGGKAGPADLFGPGSRIPALVVGRGLERSGVDHSTYDTTSIMATIEHQFRLAPVDHPDGIVPRDRLVADLGHAVAIGRGDDDHRGRQRDR